MMRYSLHPHLASATTVSYGEGFVQLAQEDEWIDALHVRMP